MRGPQNEDYRILGSPVVPLNPKPLCNYHFGLEVELLGVLRWGLGVYEVEGWEKLVEVLGFRMLRRFWDLP